MMAWLAPLESVAPGMAIGLSLALLIAAGATRLSNAPVHRHKLCTQTFAVCWALVFLQLIPLPRPAKAWLSLGQNHDAAGVLESNGNTQGEFAGMGEATKWGSGRDLNGASVEGHAIAALGPDLSEPLRQRMKSSVNDAGGFLGDETREVAWQVTPWVGDLYSEQPLEQSTLASRSGRSMNRPGAQSVAILRAPFMWLFVIGAVFFALRLVVGWIGLWRTLRRSKPLPPSLGELVPEHSDPNGPRIRMSARISSPFCFGLGRGVVIVPEALTQPGCEPRLEVVLRHEFAHVGQGHARSRALAALTTPLLFWNPVYWWLAREQRNSAELLADDQAVSGFDKRRYVEELLVLAESATTSRIPLAAGPGAVGSRREFLERMETLIMRTESLATTSTFRHAASRGVGAVLLLATVSVAWGRSAQESPPDVLSTGLTSSSTRDLPSLLSPKSPASLPLPSNDVKSSNPLSLESDPLNANARGWDAKLLSGALNSTQYQNLVRDPRLNSPKADKFSFVLLVDQPGAFERFAFFLADNGLQAATLSIEPAQGGSGFQRRTVRMETTLPSGLGPIQEFVGYTPGIQVISVESATGKERTRKNTGALNGISASRQGATDGTKQSTDIRAWRYGRDEQTDELAKLRALVARMAELDSMQAELERMREKVKELAKNGSEFPSSRVDSGISGLTIRGAIVQAHGNGEDSIIVINKGSMQGVQTNMPFSVYSGNVYKGRLKIVSVTSDMSHGILQLAAHGQKVQVGDQVASEAMLNVPDFEKRNYPGNSQLSGKGTLPRAR